MRTIKFHTILISSAAIFFGACTSTPSAGTKTGAGIGSASGAVLGAIIGHQSGSTGEGALIGAAAGGLLGGVFGNAQDQKKAELNTQKEAERQRMIQEAQIRQQQAEEERRKLIRAGSSIEDPEILAAKQAAEKAEAEVQRLRKEQDDAIRKAKEIEEYKRRQEAAQQEAEKLKGL